MLREFKKPLEHGEIADHQYSYLKQREERLQEIKNRREAEL